MLNDNTMQFPKEFEKVIDVVNDAGWHKTVIVKASTVKKTIIEWLAIESTDESKDKLSDLSFSGKTITDTIEDNGKFTFFMRNERFEVLVKEVFGEIALVIAGTPDDQDFIEFDPFALIYKILWGKG